MISIFFRPLNFLLIYIVSIIRVSILTIPLSVLFGLFFKVILKVENEMIFEYIFNIFFGCLFFVSFFCIAYILFDGVFGLTWRYFAKDSSNFKDLKEYDDIYSLFLIICEKFNKKANKVDLLLIHDNDINAYAIGGFRVSKIILTTGLMLHISANAKDRDDMVKSVAGIIGHEMSHIVNSDFLPGIFVYSVNLALKIISKILSSIMFIPISALSLIPFIGLFVKFFILRIYEFVNFCIYSIFEKKIILGSAAFISKYLSREVEYRSDLDSAKAIGGEFIYLGLEKINSGSRYFWQTMFSTHPSTPSRMKKIQNVEASDAIILPSMITEFANIWSVLMLFVITATLGFLSNIEKLYHILPDIIQGLELFCRDSFIFLSDIFAKMVKFYDAIKAIKF